MYIPSLEEKDMDDLTQHLVKQLGDNQFTIVYIQKSTGTFEVYEHNHNLTARMDNRYRFPNFIEVRYYGETGSQAIFEIHQTTEVRTTPRTIQIITKPGIINGLRNILIYL